MIKVKDNFLDKIYFDDLVKKLTSDQLPWFLQGGVVRHGDGHTQMTHNIYSETTLRSAVYNWLGPLIKKLNMFVVIRIKLNLLHRTDKVIEHKLHVDIADAPALTKSAVLYLNTNNGYTRFEDGQKVGSVANRVVIFPNNLKHGGSTNTCNTPYRLVLNMDYIENNHTYPKEGKD